MATKKRSLMKRLRKNKRMRRWRRACAAWIMRHLGARIYALSARTWNVEIHGAQRLKEAEGKNGGYFMALWHGKMLIGLPFHRGRRYQILVSASGDGDISQHLLESFNYQVIRGSSSHGGAQALREMLGALRQGDVLVITPDGPRGPMHSMNPGLPWMARATGHGVVPCGFAAEKAWHAKSWDRMAIPKPWSRVAFFYGEPVFVARDADEEDQAKAAQLIRERMLAADRQAAEALELARKV